ncbi:MAG: isoprenylcysteine carboxylmethyltransferase family protein [Deltaproteobacteria bacterium]|nr:isoprenylcysteine carboxylmethyltransferase family protein [Deltaproteobacteria bacterium]
MFFKVLTAFLVLPGIVAGLVPLVLFFADPWRKEFHFSGLWVLSAGLLILLLCVRDFCVSGKGTLAPWSPPKRLVTRGLYRCSRNPMYVGVLILVGGWFIFAASPLIGLYLMVLMVSFHLRVVFYEEPELSRLFGDAWASYASSVPRWFPVFKIFQKHINTS